MKKEDLNSYLTVLVAVGIGILVALAGSQESVMVGNIPLFALVVGLIYLIQWLVFIPSYLKRTEKFYDFTGSITYISMVILSAILSRKIDVRTLLILVLVVIWAARLGTFLFKRVKAVGEDRRFREIKKSFARFLSAWTLQALWVTFTLAAALAAITSLRSIPLDSLATIGSLLWIAGFSIEVIADYQKSKFKTDLANKGKFIRSGVWAWSRHPNYFGEIMLWSGVAIIVLPVLRGWQWVTLISPVFVTLLLTRISGVPMLESRADEKWGGQADYEDYKKKTSILIPMPPGKTIIFVK
jgi:steroid 5-alpha reductase family enzyme